MKGTVGILIRKEFTEMLRDRRVLLMSIILPVVFYPLMMGGMNALMRHEQQRERQETARVALTGAVPSIVAAVKADSTLELCKPAVPTDSLRALVETGEVDAWLDASEGSAEGNGSEVPTITLYYDQTESTSREARRRLTDILDRIRIEERQRRFAAAGGTGFLDDVVLVQSEDIATGSEAAGAEAGRMLVYVLIFMLFTSGAIFSIEQVAGEKERGTLETLFLLPASRIQIARAKVLVVSAGTIITGLLSLASLVFTYQMGWAGESGEAFQFGAQSLVLIILMVIPLAVLVGSILLAISTIARSVKEAQTYQLPAMLLVFVPALMSMSQGIELNGVIALIPIANVAFAMRDILAGQANLVLHLWVAAVTLCWAALVVRYVGALLSREEMVLGFDPEPFFARTRGGRMRALHVGMATTVVVFFYGGQLLQHRNLELGLALSLWILLPVLGLFTYRLAHFEGGWIDTLSLRAPSPVALIAAVCLGLGLMLPIAGGLGPLQAKFFPAPEITFAGLDQALAAMSDWRLLALVAVSPGLMEELVFRGVFFGLLLRITTPRRAVLTSALYFALIHLSVFRLAPTFVLGVVLALLVLRSRSLWPAVLMHAVYNGTLVMGVRLHERSGLPIEPDGVLAWGASIALLVLGVVLVARVRTKAAPVRA
ncbi:ABC transporter permease subunit/CPBP intramembrane protease [Candidatus Eisenbacteria bacterium]|uniref:ABC transporter permease subunit/CPBP intramembrane protease n=1 Tax=Eiseniibacteriota bacterium TaxID=2212470 RepID=A0ABV6YHZ6_UNCEI